MTPLKWLCALACLAGFLWLISGALAYGLFLGYWQGFAPHHARVLCASDKAQAWQVAQWGPLGLTAVVGGMIVDRVEWYGLQWTCAEEEKSL